MHAGLLRLLVSFLISAATGVLCTGAETRTIVFFGDSLTAGYGLAEPGSDAYPALVQKKIASANLPWRVINAGLSGETTAGGASVILPGEANRATVLMFMGQSAPQPPPPGTAYQPGCTIGTAKPATKTSTK